MTDEKIVTESVAPDYSEQENWLKVDKDCKFEVDVFYLNPTCVLEMENPDGTCNVSKGMRRLAEVFFADKGSVFSGCTNIFAPLYRQFTLPGVYGLVAGGNGYEVMCSKIKGSIVYDDCVRALDYFFEHYNNGRPFILAGHSQGSNVLLEILSVYMKDHPKEYSRMIAAYAVGIGVTQEYLDANPHLKFAEGATDTGVVLSWNSEGIPESGKYMESFLLGKKCRMINPLTWSADTEYVPKERNKGSLVAVGDGTYKMITGANDAKVDPERGSLICTTCKEFLPMPVMVGDVSLHGMEYALYYKDIADNLFDRITAYLGHEPKFGKRL